MKTQILKTGASILLMVLFFAEKSNSQAQLKKWAISPDLYDLPSNTISTLPFVPATGVHYLYNAMYKADGSLWFYVLDDMVYDENGIVIADLTNTSAQYNIQNSPFYHKGNEVAIVPVDGQGVFYLIFPGICFTIDMCIGFYITNAQLLNGLSPLIAANHNTSLAVSQTINDISSPFYGQRILFHLDADKIKMFQITNSSGIFPSFGSLIQPLGEMDGDNLHISEMEAVTLSNGNIRVAYAYPHTIPFGNWCITCPSYDEFRIAVYEIDDHGSLVASNFFQIPGSVPYNNNIPGVWNYMVPAGLEFSPDGNYIYFTTSDYTGPSGTPSNTHLFYNDAFNSPYATSFDNLLPSVATSDFAFSNIEYGYDPNQSAPANRKLYYLTANRIATLADPDAGPSVANWNDNAINITPPVGYCGDNFFTPSGHGNYLLPDQIDGENYLNIGSNTTPLSITSSGTSICNNAPPSITLTASSGFDAYQWSVPGTSSSVNVTSPGTYTVTVTYACNQTASTSYTVFDCCHDFNIEIPNYTINPSNAPLPGSSYDVNNNILITGGTVTFNQCNLDIKEGKQITIDANTTLIIDNASHLYSCLNMWEGIHLTNASSTLKVLNNSEIEDAENAVYANSGGTIWLDNAFFDHNYISVNLSNADYSASYIGNNCRFKCTGGYTLKAPHSNNRTSNQILLTRVLGITIGNINAQYNSFSDADKGIHGEVSNANIYNNEFATFPDNTNGSLAYAVFMNKVPLLANIGAVGQQNYFTDNSIAAYVTQSAPPSNIHIDGNVFYNCGEGAYIVNNNRVRLITASDNEMDYMYNGVNAVGNDASYLFIERNRITTFNNSINPDAGISVGDLNQTSEQSFHNVIDNNVIHSYGTYGIYLSKADNADVHENRVYLNQSNLQASVFGIRADQSSYSTFQCNEVDENASGDKKNKIGFRYFDLLRENVTCNTADGNGYGMQFIGNILKTNIRANQMSKSNHGFVIGSAPTIMNDLTNFYNTTTAQQEVPGNMWPVGSNVWDTYNFNQTTVPLLETHNALSNPDWPSANGSNNIIFPTISPTQQPLIPLFTCAANGINCVIPQLPAGEHDTGSFNTQFAQQIALSTLPAMGADEVTAWKARKVLYVNLRQDPVLQNSSTVLSEFYDSLTTENIGLLTDVDDLISQATDSSVAGDSVQVAGLVSDANAINDNISSGVMPEFNTKVVNEICLNMIGEQRGVLTGTEFNDALMVGSQCIFEGGPAVLIARNLVHTQNPFVLFNDEDLCSNFTFRTTGKENKTNTSSSVFVFPNPAKESITFAFDKIDVAYNLVIKDIAGRIIEEKIISKNTFSYKLNLNKYQAGSYLYEIKNKNETGKFEVVK